jgi:hypothetical protein
MSINKKNEKLLAQIIVELVENERPKNLQQLIDLTKERLSVPDYKIVECIVQLQQSKTITLKDMMHGPRKFSKYLKTTECYWYWIILTLIATTIASVFVIPEYSYPLVYVRNVLGALFVILLPGYSFVRALFPQKSTSREELKYLSPLERLALSVVMSIVTVSVVSLLLNFTWIGIRLIPIVICIVLLTTLFSTVAITREYRMSLEKKQEPN